MNDLYTTNFIDFFKAIHESHYDPFPWQIRLANQVIADNGWPKVMALPTSSGKTACLDIAVFALACQSHLKMESRKAPRRIFFVVDRCVIVDEAFERAKKLAKVLNEAKDGIVKVIADHLRDLAWKNEDDQLPPLACYQLRGGIYRDDAWAKNPTQPTIIASTVDQIGSRLLYRSYGTSCRTWPIHAGLAANDSLIFLDEAHCSQPFMQTTHAISRYRGWKESSDKCVDISSPFEFVIMSATPPKELQEDVFYLDDRDRQHSILSNRLQAGKPTQLDIAKKGKTSNSDDEFENCLINHATKKDYLSENRKAICIFVNRVDTAKHVYDKLEKKRSAIKGNENTKRTKITVDDFDIVLLIGRMRPIDRDNTVSVWLEKLNAEKRNNEETLEKPVIVVSTQCLEVGANLDFDGLVTECASLDALRQRFGRLNRMGRKINAKGTIVIRAEQNKSDYDDPIYGKSIFETWQWLNQHKNDETIDMSIDNLEKLWENTPDDKKIRMLAPVVDAPVMLPAHIDCWVQTNPTPQPEPDISLFLHGPQRGIPDVQVCWRSDLLSEQIEEKRIKNQWIDTISLCPPTSAECMTVPFFVVKKWFESKDEDFSTYNSDIEGVYFPEDKDSKVNNSGNQQMILRWLGPDDSEIIIKSNQIHPGDTLIIPTEYQGWDQFGFIPQDAQKDIGDCANYKLRRKAILRLHPNLINEWPDFPSRKQLIHLVSTKEMPDDFDEICNILDEYSSDESYPQKKKLRNIIKCLLDDKKSKWIIHPNGGFVWRGSQKISRDINLENETFSSDDDTSSSFDGNQKIFLSDHIDHVERFTRYFAQFCGLPPQIVNDMTLAARLHDAGKVDIRFQAWLNGGNQMIALSQKEPIAKSPGLPQSRWERRRSRIRSGYPENARHELVSVRLAEKLDGWLEKTNDQELVLHLIASHHGWSRPFAPIVEDEKPVHVIFTIDGTTVKTSSNTELEKLDSGIAERFWKLVHRYGWWGIAYLEAVFRLADHRASEWEEINNEQGSKDNE